VISVAVCAYFRFAPPDDLLEPPEGRELPADDERPELPADDERPELPADDERPELPRLELGARMLEPLRLELGARTLEPLRLELGALTLERPPELEERVVGLPDVARVGDRDPTPEALGAPEPAEEVRGIIRGLVDPDLPALLRGATSCLPPSDEPALRDTVPVVAPRVAGVNIVGR
jgi:hypothetical protein